MGTQVSSIVSAAALPHYEYIDSPALAARWALPESWIRDQVRSRSTDPIPHVRFGKYVRFRWGSPELDGWAERRIVGNTKTGHINKKDLIQ
jgi:hypothetical protein